MKTKILADFQICINVPLINAIDLHYRHRIKIFFIKKEHVAHIGLKETKNITYFLLFKAHPH